MAVVIRQEAVTVEVEAWAQVPTMSVAATHSMNISKSRGINSMMNN